jgi:general secretion pathway protein G
MKRPHGFTIVEIAVVIVIISALATLVITAFNVVQKESRDRDRQNDVLQIKAAVERYKNDNGEYPLTGSANVGYDVGGGALSQLSPGYLSAIPTSPQGSNYQYVRNINGDGYAILVARESDVTCRTGTNISTGWWGSSTPTCPY